MTNLTMLHINVMFDEPEIQVLSLDQIVAFGAEFRHSGSEIIIAATVFGPGHFMVFGRDLTHAKELAEHCNRNCNGNCEYVQAIIRSVKG
jgi:hypothetical protein